MRLFWIIHSPIHPFSKLTNQMSLSKEFYRIGYLTLSHFISNNQNIYKYFLLSFFNLQFNIPSINVNSTNALNPTSISSSVNISDPSSLSTLLPSINEWKLNARKSYKILFNFTFYQKLISLYYSNLFANYKIIKINIESIFCIQTDNNNNNCNGSGNGNGNGNNSTLSNHLNSNHWIISEKFTNSKSK